MRCSRRRGPRRRRVPLPRDRGREPGVPPHPARARRADDGHERARARARRRATRARPAPARARRRPERGRVRRPRRAPRPGRRDDRAARRHGADVDRPGGETWRGHVPLRTPYQHAVLRGKDDLAAALARLGASTDVDPADAAVAALARGEQPRPRCPSARPRRAGGDRALGAPRRTSTSSLDAVGVDFRGVVGGSPKGTLLHHAAWFGSTDARRAAARSRRRPARRLGRRLRHAARRGPRSARSTTSSRTATTSASPSGSSRPAPSSMPHFLDAADGPLAEWLLQSMSIASPNE